MQTSECFFPISTSRNQIGHIQVAGHDLCTLAEQWGTPLYIYDAQTIRTRTQEAIDMVSSAYAGESAVSYAAKAYFSLGLARKLSQLHLKLDAVSLGEMLIAQKGGFDAQNVHLHGNNKSKEELHFALHWGIENIVVDSLEELSLLETVAQEMGRKARIWLRITPGVDVDTHPYVQTAHVASKFGIPMEEGQALHAIQQCKSSRWLNLVGLHTHIGSQVFDLDPYVRAIRMLIWLAEEAEYIPQEISPGGGWGVPYREDDDRFDPREMLQAISAAIQDECRRLNWPLPKLVVEPGRWIIARAGVAIYSVGSTKFSGNGLYIVALDGGMADNPRPALYQSRYSACLLGRPDAIPQHRAALVGRFCESGDQLISEIMLPEVRRGDYIAIPMAGAYQLSMSSNYNLVPRPAVLWLEDGKTEILQKRESIADIDWWN
jgi:diaminopimelate decarboxylase